MNALEQFKDGKCAGIFSDKSRGVNVIIHTVMLDAGHRFKASIMDTISNLLLMFTMNYPDVDTERAPKLLVQVNGFEEKKKR